MKIAIAMFLGVIVGASTAAKADEPDFIMMDDMAVATDSENLPDFSTRGAVKLNAELWEDGVLPVRFSRKISPERKRMFFDACHVWEKVANVKCIEGSYKGRHLFLSQSGSSCWALWGMGLQFLIFRRHMNLAEACWHPATIMHEIGHAFGLIHEHQRPDRDGFVTIHGENAEGGFLGLNVKINFDHQGARPLTPYDFSSIMHYGRRAFSKNGKDTIVPKPGYERYLNVMGKVGTISEGDASALSELYGARTPDSLF